MQDLQHFTVSFIINKPWSKSYTVRRKQGEGTMQNNLLSYYLCNNRLYSDYSEFFQVVMV